VRKSTSRLAEIVIVADTLVNKRRRTADRIFLGSVVYTSAITLVWLFFVATQYKGWFPFVRAGHLPLAWVGLAVVVSISNTVLELFSPRGTDDFTMATTNALLCWAFGTLVY
jgi:hypothetical protein